MFNKNVCWLKLTIIKNVLLFDDNCFLLSLYVNSNLWVLPVSPCSAVLSLMWIILVCVCLQAVDWHDVIVVSYSPRQQLVPAHAYTFSHTKLLYLVLPLNTRVPLWIKACFFLLLWPCVAGWSVLLMISSSSVSSVRGLYEVFEFYSRSQ